jgi:SPP1 gp7 family putative phage head morphogenesis protein
MRSKMLDTREERVAFVEAVYAKTLDQSERKMASEVLTWLRRYERAQKERLRDVAENGIASTSKAWTQREVESYLLLNKEQWAEQLDALIAQTVTATWQAGLTETAQLLGMVSVDVTEPRILRLIADQRAQIVEGVTSRLADEIRDRLLVKLSGPTSTPELAGELTEILPELDEELGRVFGNKEARALTIARTETGKAYNSASFDRYQESGATGLQWVASNDAATRESHRELDGRIVKPGEEFKPGLRFPNDPNGAPEEVINCRCVIAPII